METLIRGTEETARRQQSGSVNAKPTDKSSDEPEAVASLFCCLCCRARVVTCGGLLCSLLNVTVRRG